MYQNVKARGKRSCFGHKSFCFVASPLPSPSSLLMFTIVISKTSVGNGSILLI